MAEEKPVPEMALVKHNSLDRAVIKLENLKKRNEQSKMLQERREERKGQARIRRYEAQARTLERNLQQQDVRDARKRFREHLFKFAQQNFGEITIKNKRQFKELGRSELYALAEEFAKKAKPWAMFQNVLRGVLIGTGIIIPSIFFISVFCFDVIFMFYLVAVLFCMMFSHFVPLMALYFNGSDTGKETMSWRYMDAYRAICKQDGPKYIRYIK